MHKVTVTNTFKLMNNQSISGALVMNHNSPFC